MAWSASNELRDRIKAETLNKIYLPKQVNAESNGAFKRVLPLHYSPTKLNYDGTNDGSSSLVHPLQGHQW